MMLELHEYMQKFLIQSELSSCNVHMVLRFLMNMLQGIHSGRKTPEKSS
jgi:hypothetical protein